MYRFTCGLVWLTVMLFLTGAIQAEPRRYALVVGVREYPASEKLVKLPYAETDATELAATLEATGYQVVLMTQTAAQGEDRLRFAPTEKFIRQEFERLIKKPFLQETDCVLVILAGHGIQLASKTDAEKQTYYFCPADAEIDSLQFAEEVQPQHNLIPVDSIYSTLKNCAAGVRLLVVDACRNDPNKPAEFRSSLSVTRPEVPAPPGGVAALFSCSANERAVEDARLKHGVFSHFLLEALNGAGDLNKDRELTITELHNYTAVKTADYVNEHYGRQQLPELTGSIQGWAAVATLSSTKTVPTPTPLPTPTPKQKQLPVGTEAGDLWEANSLKMKFSWCPPGSFTMGSPASDKPRQKNEDQVSVTLTRGFWLGQYEVTQGEWEAVMGTASLKKKKYLKEGERYAASFISWDEAREFCERLTEQGQRESWLPKGWKIDLPTEAQWEYACRAGTTTKFNFGEYESRLSEFAWWGGDSGNGNAEHEKYAHEVGQKKPNHWNFYDMHGNVSEWCRDFYGEQLPGGTDPEVTTPAPGRFPSRVIRGTGWHAPAWLCRVAFRTFNGTSLQSPDLGFRLVLVPPAEPARPNLATPAVSVSPMSPNVIVSPQATQDN